MSKNASHIFFRFYTIVSVLVFVVVALRNYLVPFNHDETATFFFYIQSNEYLPFHSHVDANNHVLNSCLSNISFHLFGSSPFALRLPNLLGLLLLILAIYQISLRLKQLGSKILLTALLLLSFHWLSFFSVCRGYGLSMALILFGLNYMLKYLDNVLQNKNLIWSLLLFQLAISSNLILIIVVLLLNLIIAVVQLLNKSFVKPLVVLIWLLHISLIYYWLSFSFYLQENGALYYGEGDSYWKVTFVSLIDLIFGFYHPFVKYVLIYVFIGLISLLIFLNRQKKFNIKSQFQKPSTTLLFAFVFIMLCLGFYLMHRILGVNYPEDRTGMFFYLFLVLWLVFSVDEIPFIFNKIVAFGISALCLIHFLYNINFRKHSLNVYETIPEHFYTTLLSEQEKLVDRITIGGHRVRELFYAFLNYRHDGALNSADPTEVMQMNCDYYIATKKEEKYFKPYYEIIDSESDWGFVLLKRKQKIRRVEKVEIKDIGISNNSNEFIEIYGHGDTTFTNLNPLMVEADLDINKVPVPLNLQLVFQVNDTLDQGVYFKRYPLQWSGDNLNGRKNLKCSITLGNLPQKAKKIVCFLWNIKQQPISVKVNSLKIYQLDGYGVNYEAPDIK